MKKTFLFGLLTFYIFSIAFPVKAKTFEIIKYGDEILEKKCEPVEKFDSELIELLDNMKETLYEKKGAGLAAPQIGVSKRIFVMDAKDKNGYIELINPEIVGIEGNQISVEGCLSIPGYIIIVDRPQKLVVKAYDRNGKKFSLTVSGFSAAVVSHEIDHLNGILANKKGKAIKV